MTDRASARSLEASAEAAAREGWTPESSRADDDRSSSTTAETPLPPGIARPAMTDNASAMSPEPATSVEPTTSGEPMVSTMESTEIDEEIKGVRVVPVAVRRVVAVVVAGGIRVVVAVRVAAPVAVVVALGIRICGARMSRVLVGAVSNILLRALARSPHVEGRHVANDHLSDS
jgi:hypothetical protein